MDIMELVNVKCEKCGKSIPDIRDIIERHNYTCSGRKSEILETVEEKEYIIYWQILGKSKVIAKNRKEAIDKAIELQDISDEDARYSITYIKEDK